MWGNNKVGIHTFVCGEKSYLKITLELNETNLLLQKCGAITMLGCILCTW
jgi:hypothetical protein